MEGLENNINKAARDVLLSSLQNLEFKQNAVFALNEPNNGTVQKIFKDTEKKELVDNNKYMPMFIHGMSEFYKNNFNKELATLKIDENNTNFGAKYELEIKENISATEILCSLDYFIEDYVNKKLYKNEFNNELNNNLKTTPEGKKIIELDDLQKGFMNYLEENNLVNKNDLKTVNQIENIVKNNKKFSI